MELLEREFDPESGITTETWYEPETDSLVVRRSQPVEGILDHNKRLMSMNQKPVFKSEVFNKMASIPNVLVEQWLKETPPLDVFNPDHQQRLRQRLNSSEYAYLRTMGGKL